MKLLYLWIENYKQMIKGQSFNISDSYHIDFDTEFNRLHISKNKEYIENFYGNNILDITAIVGGNGVGKTTITKGLYNICNSVHPIHEDDDYPPNITKHIAVYEVESKQEGEPRKLIIHYFLSEDLRVEIIEDIVINKVKLNGLTKQSFKRAKNQHDMTTVYFTNAFEINDVLDDQGFTELSLRDTHKSLVYTPMLSLHRAFVKLREHYGSKQSEDGLIVSNIEQYARNMTRDFKVSYATAQSYNYLIAIRYFPGAIARILPVMKDFKIGITEFGEYIDSKRNFIELSEMDRYVMFIRKSIYEHIEHNYKKHHWEQMYVNVICEIALFMSLTFKFNFKKLEHGYTLINSNKVYEILLEQIEDNEENAPKKELIKRIKNVKGIDLNIIKEFIDIVDRYEEFRNLATSMWYEQVQNFLKDYGKIKKIEMDETINYGFTPLIELIIEQYNNKETIYGRMINIIPQPMSSGELALINIFANLYSAINKKTSGSILLIIDEIDAFLHPEWQQYILTHITRWINESELFNKKKVQLVVATHSPIILSDIPKDKIIYLKEPFETSFGEHRTFGANISTLFYDSFFMEQGSIGEIARAEIQWVIDNIKNFNLNLDDRKRLVYIINNIGEKFLREKLKSYPVYIEATKEGRDNL